VSNRPIAFGTKGETLQRLIGTVAYAQVLPLHIVTAEQWKTQRAVVQGILEGAGFLRIPLIVRSSAKAEDSKTGSHAGEFLTLHGITGKAPLAEAIDKVFASFGTFCGENQVLIQPQLRNVLLSGVAFSMDPGTRSPYRVISYHQGCDTTAVTAGKKSTIETFYCLKGHEDRLPKELQAVGSLIAELESLMGNDALDIEFAATPDGLYLLQCRALSHLQECGNSEALLEAIHTTHGKIEELNKPHPYLLGKKTLFGVMPDWNPAEMLGLKPRPLALSLYRELITSGIWAYQRDNYGYRNLRSFPLMVDFWGLPYIDVRVSFNSFIPKTLSEDLGNRLVDFYLQTLESAPDLHDKVEFEIVLTCYTLDIEKRLERLHQVGFTDRECDSIRNSLRELTGNIIHSESGLWRKDIAKIQNLEGRISTIENSGLDDLSRLYWLVEDCKRYGTLPFAGLARAGFIAVQMLQSLVTEEVISENDYERFFQSLDTVSSQMVRDFEFCEKADFLERYGHLRPGTYDLLSPRYDQDSDRYFDWSNDRAETKRSHTSFSLELGKLRKIEAQLSKHGLPGSALDFLDFIRKAIEGREQAKFVFTRALSNALELVAKLGAQHGLSREDSSFIDIRTLLSLYASAQNVSETLRDSANAGKCRFAITQNLRLPPLVVSPDSIYCFDLPPSQPNFVTRKRVTGPVIVLDKAVRQFEGGIAFIPSADPGYDWIFARNITGLVTMFGGANSHMAIRAGELGIAAVIGAGESLYTALTESQMVELDCENQMVTSIK
jgi:glutamine kinase